MQTAAARRVTAVPNALKAVSINTGSRLASTSQLDGQPRLLRQPGQATRAAASYHAQSMTSPAIGQVLHAANSYRRRSASTSPATAAATAACSTQSSGAKRTLHSSSARRLATPVENETEAFDLDGVERATDEVDVCIVGGGPAGLSAAIRLMQLAKEQGKEDFRVVVLEKGGEIGGS